MPTARPATHTDGVYIQVHKNNNSNYLIHNTGILHKSIIQVHQAIPVHVGKDDTLDVDENGILYAVVMKLLEGLDTDHQIYMDNYYTSPTLFRDLKRLGFGACGTARVDRKGIPPTFRGKLPKGQVRTSTLSGGVLALQWMDKRLVTMLSTGNDSSMSTIQRRSRHSTGGLEVIQKPSVVVDYNTHMGGVDQADQMLSYYGFSHRTVKWWRRAFYHLFNISIVHCKN